MKAMVTFASASRARGGVLDAEKYLQKEVFNLGIKAEIYSLQDKETERDLADWAPLDPHVFKPSWPAALGQSAKLHKGVLNCEADLVYRAGLWRLPSRSAYCWSRRYKKPEIIAPHGMLDPWALKHSRWKKRLASFLFEQSHLEGAACMRALCESEARSIRSFGLKSPICLIPNGISLPTNLNAKKADDNMLLFLGRIHPKKGLVNAIQGWDRLRRDKPKNLEIGSWKFVIAGWDQLGHEKELKRLCDELGIHFITTSAADFLSEKILTRGDSSVVFVGPAFGEDKDALLRHATAFILPSFSEGLPMSVLEAWAYGLPILMTEHCNIPEGFSSDAAMRIEADSASCAEGMRNLLSSSAKDLALMGSNGLSLVERRFAWSKVALQMKEVYGWLIGGGSVPECVLP